MPYKDHEQKLAHHRAWTKEKVAKGYGKWLYARRKLRLENAERYRDAIERALAELGVPNESYATPVSNTVDILATALREAQKAEEALGQFKEDG